MTRVLVTGGAGFIGSHLCDGLAVLGIRDILVLDNLSRGSLENLSSSQNAVRFIEGDIRNRELLQSLMKDCDVVFHLAAQSSVMTAEENRENSLSSNVVGTYNVLAAAQQAGVGRVIFTSSREVYGDPVELPVAESAVFKPKNMYGASKVAGEAYCHAFRQAGLKTRILRLSNVYGPRDRDRVIPLFVEKALKDLPLTIFGGEQVIDFVWVGLVVEALLRAGFDSGDETLNIGGGIGTPIKELAQRVLRETNSSSALTILPSRSPEVARFVASISRAREVLKLQPLHDPLFYLGRVVQSIRRTLEVPVVSMSAPSSMEQGIGER